MFHGLSSPSSPKHGRGAQASDSATKKAESEAAQNSPKQGTPAQVLTRESALPATSVLHLGAEPMHSSFVSGPSLHGHISREAKPILPDEIQAARTKEPAQARLTAAYLRKHPKFQGLDQYTAGINLNGALRMRATGQPLTPYEKSKLKDADAATEVLKDAARDGHSFDGVVSRGIKHGIRGRIPEEALRRYFDLKPGDVWTTDTFLSMTADSDIAKKFGTDITMRIRQWSGVPIADISNSPHEREVLLPPETRFRVISRREENGKLALDMQELLSGRAESGIPGSKQIEAVPSPKSGIPEPKQHEIAPPPIREKQDHQIAKQESDPLSRLEAARKELESLKHKAVGDMYQQAINEERVATLKRRIAEGERKLAELRNQP